MSPVLKLRSHEKVKASVNNIKTILLVPQQTKLNNERSHSVRGVNQTIRKNLLVESA